MKKNREIVLNAIGSTLSQIAPAGTKVVLLVRGLAEMLAMIQIGIF